MNVSRSLERASDLMERGGEGRLASQRAFIVVLKCRDLGAQVSGARTSLSDPSDSSQRARSSRRWVLSNASAHGALDVDMRRDQRH